MSCNKILVIFIIAQCSGHHVHVQKALHVKLEGFPQHMKAYILGKLAPFVKIEEKSATVQKRESGNEDLPFKVVLPPAPVVEHVEEKEKELMTLYGFHPPEPGLYKVPLTKIVAPGLNTNIVESLPPAGEMTGELFGGLPPLPSELMEPIVIRPEPIPIIPEPIPIRPEPIPIQIKPIPIQAESFFVGPVVEKEIFTILVPPPPKEPPKEPQKEPVEAEAPPGLFDKKKVRKYMVFAGDSILKYLSQFFNRARITFSRFTAPPPPTPEFEN